MTTKIANTLCFIVATLTLAAIFHDNINYIAHRDHGKEVRVSRTADEHVSRIQSGNEARSSTSIHQQSSCSLLPSGCAPDAR